MEGNPFQAPSEHGASTHVVHDSVGPWRDGESVVAQGGRRWPARCVKCGRADVTPWTAKVIRRAPWFYPVLASGLLWYILFRPSMVRRATLEISLCATHRAQANLWQVVTPLAAMALAIGGLYASAQTDLGVFLLLPIVALLLGMERPRGPVFARAIDGDRVVVGGVGDPFRAGLPALTQEVELRFATQTAKELDDLVDLEP